MPVNLDVFHFHLSDLAITRYWLTTGARLIQQHGAFRGLLVASPGIPGPDDEEALEGTARAEARTARRVHEILTRASYVFAWSCLEDLLESCVREILTAQPQRLLAMGDWWRDGHLVRKQVVDGWTRERVLEELIRLAVDSYTRQPFPEVPEYFDKRLGIRWEQRWKDHLSAVCKRRNSAAHDVTFLTGHDDLIEKELRWVLECGEAIVRACAKTHGIPVLSEYADAVGQPPEA